MQEFVLTRPIRRDVGDLDDPGPEREFGQHRCEDRVFNGWPDLVDASLYLVNVSFVPSAGVSRQCAGSRRPKTPSSAFRLIALPGRASYDPIRRSGKFSWPVSSVA